MATAIKQLSKATRLQIAHNAIGRVKAKYSVEDYEETQGGISVTYYDQHENFSDECISRSTLTAFILDHYSSVSDSQLGGEHVQYEDTRSAEYYLDENMRSVLTDYLNNRKS